MSKQKYYSIKKIISKNAQYNLLLGERSNGKSYATKDYVLTNYRDTGEQFIYLRRFQLESKSNMVESYFADMPIESIFNGKGNCITVYRGGIWLSIMEEESGVITRLEKIGYICYLARAVHFKSMSYPKVTSIVFEEFVTDELYLDNEPDELQSFVSTVFRRRNGKVFLIGNTISRVCPYFFEWELTNIPKQKQGTIDIYEKHTNQFTEDGKEIVINIAVEYCENSGNNSKMFFGKSAEMITSGMWTTKDKPHLEKPLKEYEMLYEFTLSNMGFSFVCQLLIDLDNGGLFLYVYPNTQKRNIRRRITREFSTDIFVSERLEPSRFSVEKLVDEVISLNKICYASNLCGTDFETILENLGGI